MSAGVRQHRGETSGARRSAQEVLVAKVEEQAEHLVDIVLSAARRGERSALGLMRREGGTPRVLTRATESTGAAYLPAPGECTKGSWRPHGTQLTKAQTPGRRRAFRPPRPGLAIQPACDLTTPSEGRWSHTGHLLLRAGSARSRERTDRLPDRSRFARLQPWPPSRRL